MHHEEQGGTTVPSNTQLIITTPPQSMSEATSHGLPVAYMAYRIGQNLNLLRANMSFHLRAGLMVIHHSGFDGKGDATNFCRQVIRECSVRNFDGIILDFEGSPHPLLEQVINKLASITATRGWPLYVPEEYAHVSKHTRIMIPSALSGGSLSQRLEDAIQNYGAHRVALAIQRVAEDFTLPAQNGCGKALTQDELKQRIQSRGPSIYFSDELCAHYFTYVSSQTGAHFVLFDNASSIRRKIQLAKSMQVCACIVAWPEVEHIIKEILS